MTSDIVKSDLLEPDLHGFFTRKGGVSTGDYESLNCGPGSCDTPDDVRANRRHVAAALEIKPENLVSLSQCHSNRVAEISEPPDAPIRADGMVSRTRGLGLAVLTADCAPILFSSPDCSVVGAAHAGWRGALGGVIEATVESMIANGAERSLISAVVGPCISQNAYEVGPDYRDAFLAASPDYGRFFAPGNSDRFHFDLPGFCMKRLLDAGVTRSSWTGHCTYDNTDRFFSYRRTVHQGRPDYGRLASVIRIR
ncbi:MAG: peptidoglycan editing factor PgeF [Rhodobacteraceae bacterium]|nr:peptidoglycan editing factor PgeF [Paracoccaceae bacterium]MCY4136799.1 peptidoglycan editing factor PgeF [Paracoccaceae bacterium]